MITYSTNWMGPVSLNWYRERGLTEMVDLVLGENNFLGEPVGTIKRYEQATQHYSAGRIDIRGTGDPFGDEMSLPAMLSTDWAKFSLWLRDFRTKKVWNLDQIVAEYQKTNPEITWWDDERETE